jgi:predicted component of type VI protein secretion system
MVFLPVMSTRVPDRSRKKPAEPADRNAIAESHCPQCGQPMLRSWGTTCGLCRAPVAHASDEEGIAAARQAQRSLTLAWLVVVSSPDGAVDGAVLPVDQPVIVLTRHGAVAGVPGEIALRDDFLSAGHALLKSAASGAEVQFTLEDRREPGPSANGTFLNGRRLAHGEAAALCDGDELRVGSTEMVFRNLFLPGGRR